MLAPGTHVGPYEIIALIGAGAMGEVYRARDPRLDRDVAIKVLPPSLAGDPERLRRFEIEARAAAALNHPNILAVYDVGTHEGLPYIVSELLEGENLRERLLGGRAALREPLAPLSEQHPLPVRRAIEYAVQIANGLAAAHEKKIVHRDLKPENIFITTDDRPKILDFGIAKLTKPEPETPSGNTPTAGTKPGLLLGTVAYMSPEQARGITTDYRSDIFTFGAILYEMLSGRRAFQRETVADTITAVLKDHPSDLGTSDHRIPTLVVRIVERCLEKSPAARFRATEDLAFAVAGSLDVPSEAVAPAGAASAPHAAGTRGRLPWVTAALVLLITTIVLAGVIVRRRPPQGTQEVVRLTIPPPKDVGPIALTLRLSPDGSRLVFPATTTDGVRRLWVRPLNMLDAFAVPGTDDATYPFWSPDGRSIGFFADGKLKKIDPATLVATTLCDAPQEAGGTWNADGIIIFSSAGRLRRVSASGGTAVTLEVTSEGRARTTLAHPLFLPDDRRFLYLDTGTGAIGEPAIYAGAIDADGHLAKDRRLIVRAPSGAAYSQGYLFFLRDATLMAQAFDATRLILSGDPVPVVDQIQTAAAGVPGGAFAVAGGVLAYRTTVRGIPSALTWFDRSGKPVGTIGEPADYGDVEISPSGLRVAVSMIAPPNGRDILIFDLGRGLPTRFTLDPADDVALVWSPDETRVVFSSRRKGHLDLYTKASSGAGAEDPLVVDSLDKFPLGWSADGKFLLFSTGSVTQVGNQGDLWVQPWSGDGKAIPLLQTQYSEFPGRFSPDGRSLAYRSNESGRSEVYVLSFPALDRKVRISDAGGNWPRWRRDGGEIYYLAPDNTLMAVPVTSQAGEFSVGSAQALFETQPRGGVRYAYDVSPDGRRFLVATLAEQPTEAPLTVVINWPAELAR